MNSLHKTCHAIALTFSLSLWSLSSASAADAGFTVEKTGHGVTVKYNGELFTEYVTDQSNKSYLWPVIGPTGKPMTRAFPLDKNVKGEQTDHPHHRGIWFGHEKVNNFNTWADQGSWGYVKKEGEKEAFFKTLGTSKLRELREVKADGNKAVIVALNDVKSPDGKKAMEEVQTLTFQVEKDGTRVIDFDIDFTATEGPVTFSDAKDAGFCIRVPSSMVIDMGQAATTLLGAKKVE
ncbi:MAG: PmoA family protein, partial [Verrucomicrobia bacterium]|nr:PmoA family protein [Verrucomicrobiota bacterium]